MKTIDLMQESCEAPTIDVKCIVLVTESYEDSIILRKHVNGNDLLVGSPYLVDNNMELPEDVTPGIYKCTDFDTRIWYSNNPDRPEIEYDVLCKWELILDYNKFKL